MFFPTPTVIPTNWQKRYQTLRFFMYLFIIVITIIFALRVLFPIIEQGFDFRSPESSKNLIQNPRSPENTPRINGKIEQNGTLIADTTVVGDFSLIRAAAVLEKNSARPETLDFTLRRSYRSFLYPTGEPIVDFPRENISLVGEKYYALRGDMLFPFVSEQAFLSRFPKEHAKVFNDSSSLLEHFSISDEWLGFRVGSLLSNAEGVFVVVSETEVRPVGSAEIFLALGYSFEDVIPVSEEELGVYKRGRILLLGAAHPDGTILFDQDNQNYFLVDQGTKRPLLPGAYRDFLLKNTHPITVSEKASKISVSCTLVPNIFGTNLSCNTPISILPSGFGNDFELTITSPETAIDMNHLTVSFETAKNKKNMMTLLSQIKQRLLARFLP